MSDELDRRLGQLLRRGEPPARDPFFRIGLIARRERQRYRRQQMLVLAGGAGLLLASILVYGLALNLKSLGAMVAGGAALLAAMFFAVRGVRDAIRQVRGARR